MRTSLREQADEGSVPWTHEALRAGELLIRGGAAAATLMLLDTPMLARAFPSPQGEEVLRWADQPPAEPPPATRNQLAWEDLDSWITPNDRFFRVVNYQGHGPLGPALDAQAWRLEIAGLVSRTLTLTLDDLKARPRQEITFTVECGGNNGIPGIQGLIGNATWAGTPLTPILQEAGIMDQGIEVVFWGSDVGDETIREIPLKMNFGRSMSVADATAPEILLAYEMNGEPLPRPQGFPGAPDRTRLVRRRQCQMAQANRGLGHPLHEPLHGARLRHHPRGGA